MPCISIPTQSFLSKLLQDHKPVNYLEIWSANWFSLCFVADILLNWWWVAVWYERWYPNRANIEQNISLLRYYGLDNISCMYGSFIKHYDKVSDKKYDMVFLDWQKSEYGAYLQILVDNDMIDNQTLILVDDVIKYQDRMSDLYDMVSWPKRSYEIHKLDEDDGVMMITYLN